jgi:hypothetical protein
MVVYATTIISGQQASSPRQPSAPALTPPPRIIHKAKHFAAGNDHCHHKPLFLVVNPSICSGGVEHAPLSYCGFRILKIAR